EVGQVVRGVVDVVGGLAARGGAEQLVGGAVPAALDVVDLDAGAGRVPLLHQLLVGVDGLLLPGQRLEPEPDRAVRVAPVVAASGAAGEQQGQYGDGGGRPPDRRAHQFFTAPAVIPPVIRRWMKAKRTREGRVARKAAAARGPRSATPSAPRKWVRTTGKVCFSGVLSRTSAKKNSFHAVMNANSAVATMPGAS